MLVLTWILGVIAGLLLAAGAVCWVVYIAADNTDWQKLSTKVFRMGVVFLLLLINCWIYAHIFGVATGTQKPVTEVIEED